MKIETLPNGSPFLIKAEDGMVFKRKNANDVYGDEIFLGYSYYINGEKLSKPHLDVPEDFEEIPIIIEEVEENGKA